MDGKRSKFPCVKCKNPEDAGTLRIDNYIINELLLREDFPEYFTDEERTFEAIVEAARVRREQVEAELEREEMERLLG